MLHLCTLFFQYDIHKNALKSQYYYPDLIELQNAPLTYSLWNVLSTKLIHYQNLLILRGTLSDCKKAAPRVLTTGQYFDISYRVFQAQHFIFYLVSSLCNHSFVCSWVWHTKCYFISQQQLHLRSSQCTGCKPSPTSIKARPGKRLKAFIIIAICSI